MYSDDITVGTSPAEQLWAFLFSVLVLPWRYGRSLKPFSLFIVLGLALVSPFAVSQVALADESRIGGLVIVTPWARASIGTKRPAAAYLTIRNEGQENDTLVAVVTPQSAGAMVHKTTNDNGVMRMGPAGPLEIPAGGEVSLAPGGLHIMMMGLQAPLKKGESLELTLKFERAGVVTVKVPIYGPGAMRPE